MINALFSAVDRLRPDIELIKQGRTGELEGCRPGSPFGRWVGTEKSSDGSSAGGAMDSSEVTGGGSAAEPDPKEGDSGALVITVTFPAAFTESEIQSYLIHNKLTEFGDVLSTDRDIDSLDGLSVVEVVRFVVNTSMSPAEIEPIVASYSAKHVKVERQGAPAPGSPDEPVVALHAYLADQLHGHTLMVMSIKTACELVDALLQLPPGTTTELDEMARSCLQETGNIISGAFVNSWAKWLGIHAEPGVPAIKIDLPEAIIDELIVEQAAVGDDVFMAKSSFSVNDRGVSWDFYFLPTPASLRLIEASCE